MTVFIEDRNEFHSPTPVGRTRTMTPEGFLLCEGVRIARVGIQTYAARELTDSQTGKPVVTPGPDGTVVIGREPGEVFRDKAMKSFEGKPVTVEHPIGFVDPSNWKHVAVGSTHNVRQGDGEDQDFLLADLLITDKEAIDHVNRDMPQISCGYDSEYEEVRAGRGLQKNIVGNHVALVSQGRAGPRCAIQDSVIKEVYQMQNHPMRVPPNRYSGVRVQDAIRARVRDTVINTPTPAEMAEWSRRNNSMSGYKGGLQWQGDLQPVGEAVAEVKDALRRVTDKRRMKDALAQALCDIAEFGNDFETSEAEAGPAGALAFQGNDELTREDVHAANNITPEQVMKANDKFWADGGKSRAKDSSGPGVSTRATPESIQRANDAYWAKQTAWQKR